MSYNISEMTFHSINSVGTNNQTRKRQNKRNPGKHTAQTEPGLVAFYNIWQERDWVWSLIPHGAVTQRLGLVFDPTRSSNTSEAKETNSSGLK